MFKILHTFSAVICFIFLTATNLLADHITVQGTVSGNWNSDTVFVAGDLLVEEGSNLAITPGARIIFNGVFSFRVDGCLLAIGTPGDSIVFTMADTAGFSVDTIPGGGWGGIRFDKNRENNDSSIFAYCHFEYGKFVSPDPLTGHGGAIYINDYDKVRISHCLFEDNFATFNGGAVYLDSANIVIHHSSFIRNRAGLSVSPWGYGGAVCSDNSSPDLRWNTFTDNSSTGVGGGLAVRFLDCNLYNSTFTGNYSALGGGFGFLHIPECTHRINTNLVAENASTFFGGGVVNLNASPIYVNNTIVFNQSMYGGGFYCKDSVSPDFYNTIIWGNNAGVGPQGYLFEVYSQADFFYCDVQGGPDLFGGSGGGAAFFGTYEACIDEVPQFVGFGDHPYAPGEASPCIDAGSADTTGFWLPLVDLAGNPRIYNGTVDMGAYEWGIVGIEAWEHEGAGAPKQGSLEIWPNPTSGRFTVYSPQFEGEGTRVIIADLNGKLIETRYLAPGTRHPEFDISSFPDGLYFLRVEDGTSMAKSTVIKVSHR